MKRLFLIPALVFCILHTAHAQVKEGQVFHTNAIISNPDQYLVDSLKQIVKRGIRYDLFGKKNVARQMNYINACISLGKYYEKQFDSGELKSMKRSIAYYQKVVDTYYDMGSYNEENSEALSTIAAISRKLSTVYFKGKGVRKNIKLSYLYAQQGLGSMKELLPFYAKRFFNSENLLLNRMDMEDAYGRRIKLVLNPFSKSENILSAADKSLLEKIAHEFYSADTMKDLYLKIYTFPSPKIKSQGEAERHLSALKGFFIEKMNISADKIMVQSRMDGEPSSVLYRGVQLHYLLIRFSRAEDDE